MFARKRAARAQMLSMALSFLFEIALCYIATRLTQTDESRLVLTFEYWLGLTAIQLILMIKGVAFSSLYYWLVGRKTAVEQLVATFAHYKLQPPDLMEESLETWIAKVADDRRLSVTERADVLTLYASANSPLCGMIPRMFLHWSLEKAAERYGQMAVHPPSAAEA